MTTIELKRYILHWDLIRFVLEKTGCRNIVKHDHYFSASNIDGDNPGAINVFLDEHLSVVNYTRNLGSPADLFDLVGYNLKIMGEKHTFYDVMVYLHGLLKLDFNSLYVQQTKEDKASTLLSIFNVESKNYREKDEIIYAEEIDYVPYPHIDFFREGMTRKTIEKFSLGYSFHLRRTIIPLRYWMNGKLMGYNGRTSISKCSEIGIRKYMITKGYQKSINLYGLWENLKSIEKSGFIVLFEAEKSVLKRDALGDSTCVALQGHSISNEQVRIINGLDIQEVIVAMDKDVDAYDVMSICEQFYGIKKVSFIFDRNNLLATKDSPVDKNNKIYQFLLKYRIEYDKHFHEYFLKMRKDGVNY